VAGRTVVPHALVDRTAIPAGADAGTYTVKNGYFGKILTLHRKTAKLPICFSDSFFVVDTNIYCLVTNRDFRCVYGCWNPSADWNVIKSR
jgi:hypothetical protein